MFPWLDKPKLSPLTPKAESKWLEPLPTAAMEYFYKWVPLATKQRAYYSHRIQGAEMNFHVFKCSCGDNINIGQSQFAGIGNQVSSNVAVPYDLQEWVKKHRHVCESGVYDVNSPNCNNCGWPYTEHANGLDKIADDGIEVPSHTHKWIEHTMSDGSVWTRCVHCLETRIDGVNVKVLNAPQSANTKEVDQMTLNLIKMKAMGLPMKSGGQFQSYNIETDTYTHAEPVPEVRVEETPTGRKFRK